MYLCSKLKRKREIAQERNEANAKNIPNADNKE
jgi:hypothetical protein